MAGMLTTVKFIGAGVATIEVAGSGGACIGKIFGNLIKGCTRNPSLKLQLFIYAFCTLQFLRP